MSVRRVLSVLLAVTLPLASGAGPVSKKETGDVNRDQAVNVLDLQAIVAQAQDGPGQGMAADINGDGTVDAEDFALVLQRAAHETPEEEGPASNLSPERKGVVPSGPDTFPRLRIGSSDFVSDGAVVANHAPVVGQWVEPIRSVRTLRYAYQLMPQAPPVP